ncbi:MAG: SDR family NAD(P)-dependent oxidoreductase [Mycobacterium sp.]
MTQGNRSGSWIPGCDRVLDRLVVPGYSRLGFSLRSSRWPATDPAPDALEGATVLVTGANSGIGKAAVAALARLGATVLMSVRDSSRGQLARREILAALPGADLRVVRCDVSSLSTVRSFAAQLRARLPRLDAVIHNAGVLPEARSETAEGHEITLATHVLGPVLLTEELSGLLAASPDPRVVFVASGGMYTQRLPLDDPQYRRGNYRGATAYARSKRIQVALTPLLADRWADIMVASMHPGWVDTPGVSAALPGFRRLAAPILRNPGQGADTAVWLTATRPRPPSGKFWHDRSPRPEHYLPLTRFTDSDRQRMWRYCADALALSHHNVGDAE